VLNTNDDSMNISKTDLYFDRATSAEITLILRYSFERSSTKDGKTISYGVDPEKAITVDFTNKGDVRSIVVGPKFNQDDLDSIRKKIKLALLENQEERVHKAVLFCRRPLRGYYEGPDFLLLPVPKDWPTPGVQSADHPVVLEFHYDSSRDPAVDFRRKSERVHRTCLHLNVLLAPRIHVPGGHSHFWGVITSPEGHLTSRWIQNQYWPPSFENYDQATDLSNMQRARTIAPDNYYNQEVGITSEELVLPADLNDSLRRINELPRDLYDKFYRAITWVSISQQIWSDSPSSAYVALANAVEVLLDQETETCSSCGNKKFQLSKKFEQFLVAHRSDKAGNNEELRAFKQFYGLRSKILHGGALLKRDLEPWDFGGLEGNSDSWKHDELYLLVKSALHHWLSHKSPGAK
jgi:hypothetical protein